MKLKQATQLAIIGVILQLIPLSIWTLIGMRVLDYADWTRYLNFISIIGTVLLLPFFIILYKSQK
jgi:hypothetical protein